MAYLGIPARNSCRKRNSLQEVEFLKEFRFLNQNGQLNKSKERAGSAFHIPFVCRKFLNFCDWMILQSQQAGIGFKSLSRAII